MQVNKAGVQANYAYNAFGERVSKLVGGQTTEFVYEEDGNLLGEYHATDTTEVVWLGDTPLAVIKPSASMQGGMSAGSAKIYFVQPDHLDTPRVVVNAANQSVWTWNSAPFGDTLANEQPTASLAAFQFNLRFPGQQFDAETGSHYNYFRDYEAGTGRYLQSDPIGLAGGFANFLYALGSPKRYFDPFGLSPADDARALAGLASDVNRKLPGGGASSTIALAIVCNKKTGIKRGVGAVNSNGPSLPPALSGFPWAGRSGGSRHAEGNIIDGLGPDEIIESIGTSGGICGQCGEELQDRGVDINSGPNFPTRSNPPRPKRTGTGI